uniref:Large ribosomal subunit protein bL32c n=1 Tax=Floydiella terrestris TaxID=51328 RepID=E2DSH9_FLOTE|nr:ribosomal protein L32 [Floydiella terrestris]ACZ58455.1 ribosomal protein L32 [Floydiella terrestris]
MAVPKKRTSKSKKNIRKDAWKKKVYAQATRALFLAKRLPVLPISSTTAVAAEEVTETKNISEQKEESA